MEETKQPQPVRARVEARTVSLYPCDWDVVRRVARDVDGNESFALRSIIREWNSGKDGGSGKSE